MNIGAKEFAPLIDEPLDWHDFRDASGTIKRVGVYENRHGYRVEVIGGKHADAKAVGTFDATKTMAQFIVNELGGTMI